MTSVLKGVLNGLDQVVLELVDSNKNIVKCIEGSNSWVTDLFPNAINNIPFAIDDKYPFLEDFMIDAKRIWSRAENSKIKSGLWTEQIKHNRALNLEAIAIKHDEQCLLIVCNQFEEFKERQRTLQVARELMLSNDKLLEQHEYLHSRLLSILNKPKEDKATLLTLTKIIENVDFSVMILDKGLNPVIENSAVLDMFDITKGEQYTTNRPMDILLKLMKSQLPEFDRIFKSYSTWTGELCWMNPPSTLKWLKIGLYPVTNEFNEIKNWIVFISDITNIKHLTQRNEHFSLLDMLTDLPNRYAFWQSLEKQIEIDEPFYLLYIDINDFRQINEFYGHEEGDRLLIELSRRLESSLKKTDFIARVGGDEFAIILSKITDVKSCEKIANRLLNIAEKPFLSSKADDYSASLSLGAANYPKDAQNAQELMKCVDLSAYNGKQSNKNSLLFYTQELEEASRLRIQIEKELSLAISNGEFELFLQPIMDLNAKAIVKAEALVRWHHPERGLINPEQFIPIAEQSELIITLGKWIFNSACQISKNLSDLGFNIKISINLSPSQVIDEELFNFLSDSINTWQVDPALLELEITEGVLVDDYDRAEKLLNNVRSLGMSVAVDDFGTGYSSLAYLKKLPLDYLKIDRSFVKDIATDDNDKAIVLAVIALAHKLNLGVIAEGVETSDQKNFLAKNFCNSAQGYLFSQPINYDGFVDLLTNKTIQLY